MLAQNSSELVAVVAGGVVLTWLLLIIMLARQRRELAAVREALKGSGGERLEPLLVDHLRSKTRLEGSYENLDRRVGSLEQWTREAVAHVGFVRYNAFEDVGGEQSFALALQNADGDGVVITTVVGREQARIYGKALRGGRCDQSLTPEEQEALRLAKRPQPSRPSA